MAPDSVILAYYICKPITDAQMNTQHFNVVAGQVELILSTLYTVGQFNLNNPPYFKN